MGYFGKTSEVLLLDFSLGCLWLHTASSGLNITACPQAKSRGQQAEWVLSSAGARAVCWQCPLLVTLTERTDRELVWASILLLCISSVLLSDAYFGQGLICFLCGLCGKFTSRDLILVAAPAGGSSYTETQHRRPEDRCGGCLESLSVISSSPRASVFSHLQWDQQ